MKIQCQSCQAKYTIADEKVLGKVVKIRCKKCSSTIVINGNEMLAARDADEGGATAIFDYAAHANEQWTVNVADGDQRTMTPQDIVAEYRNGVVNDETYCWKEDMPDWLPLREIEQLYSLVGAEHVPQPSIHEEVPVAAPVASVRPAPAPLFAAPEPAASPFSGHTNGNGHGNAGAGALFGGAAEAVAPAPASAARRGGGRGQGADLFGNVERAGGDDDVMTSAHVSTGGASAAAAAEANDKLMGQRNENSVLFSLSALTENKNAPPTNRTTATGEGSGLIDIRALSQSMGSDEKKDTRGRVDDIMNLSGGGAFGAALAAPPILAPPPVDLAASSLGQDGGKPNKTMIFAILGGATILGIFVLIAIMMTRGGSDKTEATKDDGESTKPTTVVAANDMANTANTGSTATTPQPTAQAGGDPTPPPTPVADNTPPPPGVGQATGGGKSTTAAAANPSKGSAGAAKPASETHTEAAPKPADPPKAAAPTDFGSAIAAAAGKPANDTPKASSGGGGSSPFDRGAAAAALGGVNVQSCKKPGGPTGSGHVKVTFAPDGSVSAAVLDDDQYPGTPVGGCVAGKYRGAHVPAFSGSSVTVGKSFTIN